jgi:conjugative relaxase-like TrwC/TraI family protein
VGQEQIAAVLAGDHPATGEPVAGSRSRVTVAAFDLTFCAPKSVSLLQALGGPDIAEQVEAAHARAVSEALGYLESRASAVKRHVGDLRVPVETGGVAAAAFRHHTSRALDPHLHTHVVVANLGRSVDGVWSALDGRGFFAHRSAADALYHADLRSELTERLGVDWGELKRGRSDIAGIGDSARAAFSQRSAQIARYLQTNELAGPRAASMAAHFSRPAKDPTVSVGDLRQSWEERAVAVGLGPRRLASVLDRVPRRQMGGEELDLAGPIAGSGTELASSKRPVARRDLIRAYASSLRRGAPSASVESAADHVLEGFRPVKDRAAFLRSTELRGVAEDRFDPAQFAARDLGSELSVSRIRSARIEESRLDDLLARRQMGVVRGFDRDPGMERLGPGLEIG